MRAAKRQRIWSDDMEMSDLCQHLDSVSWAIANAITTLPNRFHTTKHKKLKKLLISSLWIPLQGDTKPAIRDKDSRKSLQRIASALESLFNKGLKVVRRVCKAPASAQNIIHPILRHSNIDECIQALEAWEETRKGTNKRKASPTTDAVDIHDDPNPPSAQHPVPVIDCRVLQGETSIHSRAELLFTYLHQHWPCRVEGHRYETHKGKLGHCKSARFCIGPSWNFDTSVDSFSVILLGENVLQECNITIQSSRDPPSEKDEIVCCRVIPESPKHCLDLVIRDDNSLRIYRQQPANLAASGLREMTLREMIDKVSLTICVKRVIGLILARAILHLLGSRWVYEPISDENITFYYMLINDRLQFHFDKVFISTKFAPDSGGQESSAQQLAPSAPLPGIGDLAIILGKLELGVLFSHIDEQRKISRLGTNPAAVGGTLLKECRKYVPSPSTSIEGCLELSISKDFGKYNAEELLSNQKFVEIYYSQVIRPLEGCLLKNGWTTEDISSPKTGFIDPDGVCQYLTSPLSDPRMRAPPSRIQSAKYRPILALNPTQDPDEDPHVGWLGQPPDCALDYQHCQSTLSPARADRWFDNLKRLHDKVYRILPNDHIDKTIFPKIAIIDTGCQLEHSEIMPFVQSKTIAAYKDFVLKNDSITDTDGHGTHVTHLLLKSAPYVEVYLARVFETSKAVQETPSLVAKAIEHAVNVWHVDIISMSLAFDNADSQIAKAINYAAGKNTLLFAAASNNRANERSPVGYPARDANVICVNSTDDQGNKSTFSPRGVERDYNFAILGEMVQGAWPKHLQKNGHHLKRESGTSQATPILAGIASTILHITRLKQFGPKFKMEWRLKEARGMSQVLYNLMTETRRAPEYNYVTPGDLFSSDPRSIMPKIHDALDNV